MDIQDREFEILGNKFRLKEEEAKSAPALQAIDIVRDEISRLTSQMGNISREQVLILAALKIANEKIELEQAYSQKLHTLNQTAIDALNLIEEATPTH